MWLKWFPWKFILGYVAKANGFLDPISVLASLHRFAQPSEVGEPIELLRAGVVFHARGLINSRVIQHNLDWVWPYWIERQFDPNDIAFTPRAFSITHINMTNRNWTAVGLPDAPDTPVVDPRGLATPLHDGWSIDFWVVCDDGRQLLPSRCPTSLQRLDFTDGLAIVTESHQEGMSLVARAEVRRDGTNTELRLTAEAAADSKAWIAVTLRPCNPEGVSFIHDIAARRDHAGWIVDGKHAVNFDRPALWHTFSCYREGDVHLKLPTPSEATSTKCDVGMATAAALFEIPAAGPGRVEISVPLPGVSNAARTIGRFIDPTPAPTHHAPPAWADATRGLAVLQVPDPLHQSLYDAHIRTLILHSPDDAVPGPYTYKRFWFRDSAFIMRAMLAVGMVDRVERGLDRFAPRQLRNGYFLSQEGEWDSNGEALWIYQQFCEQAGRDPKPEWRDAIARGARWIYRKRLSEDINSPHAGLLPAGFSAEHLGPNDYYFWDDFWGVAGLRSASWVMERYGDEARAREYAHEADAFMRAIDRSLKLTEEKLGRPAAPASPHRRLDAGAIGSLVATYPLQLWEPRDPRTLDLVEFLLANCMYHDGFFQDMIHSGVNPYLTLNIAQALLRAGDERFLRLVDATARLASPTGQWPEAVHPRTGGGCMGDGQHVWAAAEWIMMIRNMFIAEEGDTLILAAGVPQRWIDSGEPIRFGPAPTAFGEVTVTIQGGPESPRVTWSAKWRNKPARVRIAPIGRIAVEASPDDGEARLGEPAERVSY